MDNSNSITKNKIKQIKQEIASGNANFLRKHPELRAIVRVFLHELIDKEPDNIYKFSASVFNCNNSPLIVTKINKQLERLNDKIRRNHWSYYDFDEAFSESTSAHSLLSRDSTTADIDRMLRFALILRERQE